MTGRKSSVFSFEDIEVREGEFLLIRGSEAVPVEPKAYHVLLYLVQNPGRLVTKEEIVESVWNGYSVSDNSLTRSIATLRRLLQDDAREPRYIATVQTVGYRFLPPVQVSIREIEKGSSFITTGDQDHLPDHGVALVPDMAALPGVPTPPPVSKFPRRKPGAVLVLSAVAIVALLISFFATHPQLSGKRLSDMFRRLRSGREAATHLAVTRRRLSANPEDTPVASSVISPDGKLLAYADATGPYFRLVETGETHPVPLPKGFDATPESWFPDSIHLVVSSIDDLSGPPSLWKISILGGTPRKLAERGSRSRVSPDAAQIAFLRGPFDSEEIWLSDANGDGARKVVDGRPDFCGPVAWAPDGKRFAYVRSSLERPERRIEIYDRRNGRTHTVLSVAGLGSEIAWTITGRLIYSLGEAQPNHDDSNLWSIQLDKSDAATQALPVRLTDDRDGIGSLSATSDGARIALLRYHRQSDIYISEIEARGKKLSPLRRFTMDERQDFPSSWTPDSRSVLVVSDRDGPSHIFTQEIDHTQPELLVGGKEDVWLPHMSPDGQSMLYLASPAAVGPSDKVRMMRVSLGGGPSQMVLEQAGIVNYQCARLPSKVCVYGQIDAEHYRFFTFNPSDGARAEISTARFNKESGLTNWNLSPDGKYLAVVKSQHPYEEQVISVITVSSGAERSLQVSPVRLIMGVDWAADSKSIWAGGFMGRGSWGARSGLINVDLSGKVNTLIRGTSPEIMGGTPSPDGHRLAIGANTFNSNVWLIENF